MRAKVKICRRRRGRGRMRGRMRGVEWSGMEWRVRMREKGKG